jgi:fucokinase
VQAALYQQQLEAARYFGRIAKNTLILAVPDPQGKRIGSGGATLSALRVLADQLSDHNQKPLPNRKPLKTPNSSGCGQGSDEVGSSPRATAVGESSEPSRGPEMPEEHGGVGSRKHGAVDPRLERSLDVLAGFRVLLIHGGGDSKRVPWANPIGKPFIPLPFLVPNDSDEPVPTLFDHILAVAAPAMGAMEGGGVLIMTGESSNHGWRFPWSETCIRSFIHGRSRPKKWTWLGVWTLTFDLCGFFSLRASDRIGNSLSSLLAQS